MPIDGRVTAAIDHAGSIRVDLEPVAMTPYRATTGAIEIVRIGFEITGAVSRISLVVPEPQRHRGQRFGANQFADLIDDGAALLIEGFHGRAQKPALHQSRRLREFAVGSDERAGEVGTPRHVRPPDVRHARRYRRLRRDGRSGR